MTTSSGPAGRLALGDGDDRVPSAAGRIVEVAADAGGAAAAADDLAVLADDEGALVGDVAVGPLHPVDRRELVDDIGRHRPGVAAGEAAGRRPRPAPGRTVTSGAVCRNRSLKLLPRVSVKTNVPATKATPEDDRERAHPHPELVREQAFQRCAEHLRSPG